MQMTKPRCKWCRSTKVVKSGKRMYASGPKQNWHCNKCGRNTLVKIEADNDYNNDSN